jgi:hypothetical protein
MKSAIRPSLALAFLSVPAIFLAAGCGSSSTPTSAKNMYVIQAAQTNSVETDSVLVFPTTASGASTPASTVSMPSGFFAISLATGPKGELYVGGQLGEGPGEILVFAPGAKGSVSPVTTFTGGTSGTFDYPDFMTVNDKGQLFVMSDDGSIEGFAANATSTDAPTQYITTYQTNDTFSFGIGADAAGNIYVDEVDGGTINVFAAGATGAATPARTITGMENNSFGVLFGVTADADGNVMVVNFNPADDPFEGVHSSITHANKKLHLRHDMGTAFEQAKAHPNTAPATASTGIYSFAANASGAATPTSAISGTNTTVNEPEGMTADALNNIYYVDFEGGTLTFMSFKAGTTGNVAPTTSATSTAYNNTNWFAVIAAY